MGVFKAFHAAHEGDLDVERQAGGDTVRIVFVRGQAFGFEENLVAVFVGEAVDFVFDRRAVARADASILPVNIGLRSKPERMISWVCVLVCVSSRTLGAGAFRRCRVRTLRERVCHRAVRSAEKINRAPVDARRRAGFQTALRLGETV